MGVLLLLLLGLFVTAIGIFWVTAAFRAWKVWKAIHRSYDLVPYGLVQSGEMPALERPSAIGGVGLIVVGLSVTVAAALLLDGRYTPPPAPPVVHFTDPRTGEPVDVPLTPDDQRRMRYEPGAVLTEKYIQVQQGAGSLH